jgi:hypothetical protein
VRCAQVRRPATTAAAVQIGLDRRTRDWRAKQLLDSAGAIAGAAIVIGRQTIHGWLAIVIGVLAFQLLQKRIKVPEPALVVAGAGAGLLRH